VLVYPSRVDVSSSTLRYLSIAHLAVRDLPGSGSGRELLAWAGIDASHIAAAARRLTAGQ
jgi:hypothetical protein